MSEQQDLPVVDVSEEPKSMPVEKFPVGSTLREAREKQGFSLEMVSEQLKFSVTQLKAIENEAWDVFPKVVILRGLIRNYAKLLGLDDTLLLQAIAPVSPPQQDVLEPLGRLETPLPRDGLWASLGQGRLPTKLLIAVVAVVVLVVSGLLFFSWNGKTVSDSAAIDTSAQVAGDNSEEAASTSTVPSVVASEPVSAPVGSEPVAPVQAQVTVANQDATINVANPTENQPQALQGQLVLQARARSWVEVRDPQRKVIFSQHLDAGAQQSLSVEPGARLTVGNANSVDVTWKSQPLDLTSGHRGNVVRLNLN